MENYNDPLEYPLLAIGSEELSFLIKDENFLDINCLQSGVNNPGCSGNPYLNIPDTTMYNNVPCPTSRLPSMEDYPGPFNFSMDMNKPGWDRGKWEFSKTLNKIFVVMECKVPLMFKWNQQGFGLFVRALPVFLDQDYFEEPVRRCASHCSKFEKSNEGFEFVDHVIRCEHGNTIYEKNPESQRFSVLVPLDHPQPGADGSTIVYTFMCKNSCSVGMNRRSTGIIFTLERENGEVVGRKMLKLRICSCPRRDLRKEERDVMEKDNKNQNNEKDNIAPVTKKPLKRLMKQKDVINFQIRLPGCMGKTAASVATIIKESIMNKSELTSLDKAAIEDCDKYM